MESTTTFCTDRLIAARLRVEERDELGRMPHDPSVLATLGDRRAAAQTPPCLHDTLRHGDRHGEGLWRLPTPADRRFVGRGGLRHGHVEGRDAVEGAAALRAACGGRGRAPAMAPALVTGARPFVTNPASRRRREQGGGQCDRALGHAGLPHVWYRIKHEDDGRA
jgi:hypothetical protein